MDAIAPAARKTAKDFPQELLELYDYYAHGRMTKREFLDRAGKYAVGGVTAAMLLSQLAPNYALAQQVAEDDPEISTSTVTYPSPDGTGEVNAYMVRPANFTAPGPAVLVIHENRGLNPYIEDVARRLGKAGFLALAPDGLTSLGGYPGSDDQGRELQAQLDTEQLMNDFFAGFEYLNGLDETSEVGAVGFCYGGGVVNAIAVAYPELGAGVSFYGRQPEVESVVAIEAAMLVIYAALDERINQGAAAYEAALAEAGVTHRVETYEGVNHGFHNDTTPRYDEAAARRAEAATIAWFNEHLRG